MKENSIKNIIKMAIDSNSEDEEITCMILSRFGYIQWEKGYPIGITNDECDDSTILSFKKDEVQKSIDRLPEFFIGYLKSNEPKVVQQILPDLKTFICRVMSTWDVHDEYFTIDKDFDYFG